MFKVIVKFVDLKDNNHRYEVGDVYPRKGYEPSMDRIEELASDKNRRKTALIQEIEETKAPLPRRKRTSTKNKKKD